MATRAIRTYGDPVLTTVAEHVAELDGSVAKLVADLSDTLRESGNGIGLAANQIGVGRRVFVWRSAEDVGGGGGRGARSGAGDGKLHVVVNPVIVESRGEWTYEEGCLSVPGLHWPIDRPGEVHLAGIDLHGREISIDADELIARVFLHEMDHLDGVLLVEHLSPEQRAGARRALQAMALGVDPDELPSLGEEGSGAPPSAGGALSRAG